MAKKKETIEIPLGLAKLLAAEVEDFKEPEKYDEVQAVSRKLLALLIEAK